MDYRIGGTGRAGFGAVAAFSRQNYRRLILLLCTAICAFGIAILIRTMQNSAIPTKAPAEALDGTWELKSLNGLPIGETTSSAIVSQRVSFREGKIRGETLIRANTDAATSAMPFPDESVTKVLSNSDETGVRVLWNGTYDLDEHQQLALHIGKAIYFIKVTRQPDTHSLELNQDTILTVHGTAKYQRASSSKLSD
jgi:hypothetical protein